MAITDWPSEERPREKLLKLGPKNLTDTELLAIFLRTGIAGLSAVDLARNLLQHYGSLTSLFAADKNALCNFPGVGLAKYAQLQAVLEMSKRALGEKLVQGKTMNTPQIVRDFLRLHFANKPHEVFLGIFLDARNHMILAEELFSGTLTQASIYPREIIKRALHHNAAAIIFAHNHPSGIAEPSNADKMLTQTLKKALELIDIQVLDHFIIGKNEIMSFAEEHLL